MNPRQRQLRFQRLRELEQIKLDRLAGLARAAADRVEQARVRLHQAEQQFEQELREASGRPEMVDQLQAWERRMQRDLKALQQRLGELELELAAARKAVEQQQNRIRAWDKLLERLGQEATAVELAQEIRRADEAYLQKQMRKRSERVP